MDSRRKSMFIIMKSSRAYEGATILNAYSQPDTCACAGVEQGKLYSDKKSAQIDADKLSKCNPVGFVVVTCNIDAKIDPALLDGIKNRNRIL
jgi:hypothetical protein